MKPAAFAVAGLILAGMASAQNLPPGAVPIREKMFSQKAFCAV